MMCCVETMEIKGLYALFYMKFIILLAISSTVGYTWLCPSGCLCFGGSSAISLTVDCHRNVNVIRELLEEEIDSMLLNNVSIGYLMSLNITNTPLTDVPRSVCRLTTLSELNLDYNRLARLPDNCLSNLTALTSLTASFNRITELQDGVLDGLHRLRRLILNDNLIVSIGVRVFHCPQKLTSLKTVDLHNNRIQRVEPWPLYLGLNGQKYSKTLIDLRYNNISNFSNMMRCKPHCGMKIYINVKLDANPIKHLSDMLRGWNASITTFQMCLFLRRSSSVGSFQYIYLECDCVDFDLFKILLSPIYLPIYYLSKTYCKSPPALHRRTVITVPLDQFVCELTEKCPLGCRCVHRPANATLHIYCSDANHSDLPLELPTLPKSYTKYKLEFANNRHLRRLEHRDYFVNTSILDLSNCNLESIDFDMWNELANISRVLLDGNRLQSLPSSIAAVNLRRTHISLGENPWKCSCDASWMSDWLKSVNSSLVTPYAITCASPARFRNRNIVSIDRETFCVDPTSEAVKKTMEITIPSAVGTFIVLLSIGFIIYRLRVKLYTNWKFHPFDSDECLGEDLYFDVFLACCSDDNLPDGNEIRVQLEQRGYRVCYPPRDFIAGESIYANIYNAVVCSKRTVCFITSKFLQSGYCMNEFDIAYHHNIMVKRKKRLVILMALDSLSELYANNALDTTALRQYVRQYTYIDYRRDDWLDALVYALPLHGMLQTAGENQEDQQQSGNIEDDDILLTDPFQDEDQQSLGYEGPDVLMLT